ncbi:hypothetical protein [Streptomyces sp. NPDC048606]|uniref:hypothetical protein n=1 Tax=Streptomyces sp. NPDC048606 TaxID=3154726 RepID=UPI0034318455
MRDTQQPPPGTDEDPQGPDHEGAGPPAPPPAAGTAPAVDVFGSAFSPVYSAEAAQGAATALVRLLMDQYAAQRDRWALRRAAESEPIPRQLHTSSLMVNEIIGRVAARPSRPARATPPTPERRKGR